jgi:hypothetical protein
MPLCAAAAGESWHEGCMRESGPAIPLFAISDVFHKE